MINKKNNLNNIKEMIDNDENIKYIIANLNNIKPENLKYNYIDKLIEEIYYKVISGRLDLAARNLGVTNYGELRFFDPSYD